VKLIMIMMDLGIVGRHFCSGLNKCVPMNHVFVIGGLDLRATTSIMCRLGANRDYLVGIDVTFVP
jgi:hypothetical protein